MRTVGLAVAGLVILAGSGIGLYRHVVLLADEPAGVTAPITSVSSDVSLLQFREQPRPLPDIRFIDKKGAATARRHITRHVLDLSCDCNFRPSNVKI